MPKKAKVVVHPAFEIGEISPRLYSAFLEPIGNISLGMTRVTGKNRVPWPAAGMIAFIRQYLPFMATIAWSYPSDTPCTS